MESRLSFFALFFLIMQITVTVYARPNPEEYQQDSHVRQGSLVSTDPTKRSPCNQRKSSNEDFQPRPNISVYDNSAGLKDKKIFPDDFEPRPNISMYENGASVKGKKMSDEEFEPRPNISVYDNSATLKGKRTFDEEFEPRPSATAYKG
ncbi:organ-specific protein S2 isoform X1 [Lactuca sativa]|uniref:organ-specific protein S2 isoform X1 n=1 Tax=Lactuca sativa TaxID=4236 RepID=UPI000CC1C60E|nr:organ-specific protein S2 isoform X1 [Lactuca sativa]